MPAQHGSSRARLLPSWVPWLVLLALAPPRLPAAAAAPPPPPPPPIVQPSLTLPIVEPWDERIGQWRQVCHIGADGQTVYVITRERVAGLWPGLVFAALHLLGAAAAASAAFWWRMAYRIIRRHSLPVEGVCRPCGYPLKGLKSKTCPECGAPLTPDNVLSRHMPVKWRRFGLLSMLPVLSFAALIGWGLRRERLGEAGVRQLAWSRFWPSAALAKCLPNSGPWAAIRSERVRIRMLNMKTGRLGPAVFDTLGSASILDDPGSSRLLFVGVCEAVIWDAEALAIATRKDLRPLSILGEPVADGWTACSLSDGGAWSYAFVNGKYTQAQRLDWHLHWRALGITTVGENDFHRYARPQTYSSSAYVDGNYEFRLEAVEAQDAAGNVVDRWYDPLINGAVALWQGSRPGVMAKVKDVATGWELELWYLPEYPHALPFHKAALPSLGAPAVSPPITPPPRIHLHWLDGGLLLIACPETKDWLVWHMPSERWIARLPAAGDMSVRYLECQQEIVMLGYTFPAAPRPAGGWTRASKPVLLRFDLKGLIPSKPPVRDDAIRAPGRA